MKKTVLSILIFLGGISLHAQFKQLPLPYSYQALEPYIDATTMEIHYTKHHVAYLNNLNKAIETSGLKLNNDNLIEIFEKITFYNQTIRNNAGGHYNHTFFWSILTPTVDEKLLPHLESELIKSFGSVEQFKQQFIQAGLSHFGSGWVWLILTTENKLAITTTPNQDNPLMENAKVKGTPLLGIDLWEHAYYLKYQNRRADYLEAIWHVINWKKVSELYLEAILSK